MRIPPLASMARRLHALAGEPHRVTSALGAWLLLATVARGARDEDAYPLLDAALGMPRADAIAAADRLISSGHPVIHDAYAAWVVPALHQGRLLEFFEHLPGDVSRGIMPTQAEADAWASRKTRGLITEYPADLGRADLTLASALACQVSWRTPFRVVDAKRLGRGQFASETRQALGARLGDGHEGWLSASPVGTVAAHCASAEGLSVWSVIAAPDVPPLDVLDVAHAIATDGPSPLSLADLPLGDGPAWTVSEIMTVTTPYELEHGRITDVTVPAWTATTRLELKADPVLGFGSAAHLLGDVLGTGDFDVQAVQSAKARYHRVGFEAAAVTAMALAGSAMLPIEKQSLRVARLRFAHPYAVVAVATQPSGQVTTPWDRLPVFSAWVAATEEPED